MIVDTAGRFVSQREIPALAMIVPELSASSLQLTAPGREPLDVPLDQSGAAKTVTVWRDSLPAIDQGSEAAVQGEIGQAVHALPDYDHQSADWRALERALGNARDLSHERRTRWRDVRRQRDLHGWN